MDNKILRNYFLQEIKDSIIKGPAIAISYPLQKHEFTTQISGKDFYVYEVSRDDKQHKDIDFICKVNNFLGKITGNTERGYGHFHFKNQIILAPRGNYGVSRDYGESNLVSIIGITNKFFEESYNDSVEAMYTMDSLGKVLLEHNLNILDKTPDFITADYNFLDINQEFFGEANYLEGEFLEKFLNSKLEIIRKKS